MKHGVIKLTNALLLQSSPCFYVIEVFTLFLRYRALIQNKSENRLRSKNICQCISLCRRYDFCRPLCLSEVCFSSAFYRQNLAQPMVLNAKNKEEFQFILAGKKSSRCKDKGQIFKCS